MKAMIMKWYKQGLWSLEQVKNAVEKGVITAEEFKEITETEYEE